MLVSETTAIPKEVFAGLRVLIADDNRSVLTVMNHLIRFLGHVVVGTAINGRECIRRATDIRPDLVIVDLTMADLDGIETAEAILKVFPVPIIIVTGASDEEVSERLKDTDIAGHLTKPFNLNQVRTAITAALEARWRLPWPRRFSTEEAVVAPN